MYRDPLEYLVAHWKSLKNIETMFGLNKKTMSKHYRRYTPGPKMHARYVKAVKESHKDMMKERRDIPQHILQITDALMKAQIRYWSKSIPRIHNETDHIRQTRSNPNKTGREQQRSSVAERPAEERGGDGEAAE